MSVVRPSFVVALAVISCSVPDSFTLRLSLDTLKDPVIQRCLADPQGRIPRVTDDEPFVAADSTRGGHALAIWQTRSGVGSVIQWAHSTDDGRNWSTPRAVAINACAGGPVPAGLRSSDPWVTTGPDGRWYLSAITWTPGEDADLVNALVAVTSADGGATWDAPVAIAASSTPAVSHDNLALTADPTQPGTAYATTTLIETPEAGTYYGRLGFSRTRDGGRTWEALRPLSPAVDGERIGAPQVVVDPRAGRVFAVYHGRYQQQARIGVLISDDHGATWSPEIVAASHVRGARVHHPDDSTRFVLADDILQAVVSPIDGRIVIAYADAHRRGGQQHDVSLVWSIDGRDWSEPIAVSTPEQRTSWLPAVAVMADGSLGVTFQSADFTLPPAERRARVFLRRFTPTADGYEASSAELLDEGPLGWPGDYQSVTALDGGFLAVYGQAGDIKASFAGR